MLITWLNLSHIRTTYYALDCIEKCDMIAPHASFHENSRLTGTPAVWSEGAWAVWVCCYCSGKPKTNAQKHYAPAVRGGGGKGDNGDKRCWRFAAPVGQCTIDPDTRHACQKGKKKMIGHSNFSAQPWFISRGQKGFTPTSERWHKDSQHHWQHWKWQMANKSLNQPQLPSPPWNNKTHMHFDIFLSLSNNHGIGLQATTSSRFILFFQVASALVVSGSWISDSQHTSGNEKKQVSASNTRQQAYLWNRHLPKCFQTHHAFFESRIVCRRCLGVPQGCAQWIFHQKLPLL